MFNQFDDDEVKSCLYMRSSKDSFLFIKRYQSVVLFDIDTSMSTIWLDDLQTFPEFQILVIQGELLN